MFTTSFAQSLAEDLTLSCSASGASGRRCVGGAASPPAASTPGQSLHTTCWAQPQLPFFAGTTWGLPGCQTRGDRGCWGCPPRLVLTCSFQEPETLGSMVFIYFLHNAPPAPDRASVQCWVEGATHAAPPHQGERGSRQRVRSCRAFGSGRVSVHWGSQGRLPGGGGIFSGPCRVSMLLQAREQVSGTSQVSGRSWGLGPYHRHRGRLGHLS